MVSLEQAEALLRAMARTFGGDPAATDATRVLRIPGFKNRKYETDFLVRAEKHTDRVYHLSDFSLPTEPAQTDFRPRRPGPSPRLSEPRPLTQSEHDWAYAKRALARGDDPEEIVRRIADYRAHDKHDALYYARLTVSKTQAESRASSQREGTAHLDSWRRRESRSMRRTAAAKFGQRVKPSARPIPHVAARGP